MKSFHIYFQNKASYTTTYHKVINLTVLYSSMEMENRYSYAWTQIMCGFRSCLRHVGDLRFENLWQRCRTEIGLMLFIFQSFRKNQLSIIINEALLQKISFLVSNLMYRSSNIFSGPVYLMSFAFGSNLFGLLQQEHFVNFAYD